MLQGNATWLLEKQYTTVSAEEIEEIIAIYERILDQPETASDSVREHLPEIQAGIEEMLYFKGTGFQLTTARNGIVHPDNHRLTEIISAPFADPFDPVSQELASIATATIARINQNFAGILKMDLCAAADHGSYRSGHKSRIPGAHFPLFVLMAARHAGLQNPRISNGSAPMAHGGTHITAGLANKERLGDVLRVLLAITPTLMVLTENNGLDATFPVRLLHGSWLGQNPANYPRMGARFFAPDLANEQLLAEYWGDIFTSPIIVELQRVNNQFVPTAVDPENFNVTVDAYLRELEARYPHEPALDWNSAIRQQSKTWGLYRIREITEGSEVLVEYRPLDTQTPHNALAIQAVVQAILQNEAVLDGLLAHFEALGVVPKRGQNYSCEDLQELEANLRETALRALSGRTAEDALPVQGLAAPYLTTGFTPTRHTLAETANVLQTLAEAQNLPSQTITFLAQQREAHATRAVALLACAAQDGQVLQ